MSFNIRRAIHSDAEGIINVHIRSIREICSKDYTNEQIEAWSGRKSKAELWVQTMDRDFVWVVEHNSEVMGFGHLAIMDELSSEVMGLYFIAPAIGHGLAKKLFKEFIQISSEHQLTIMRLHSTVTAKSFYESLGFRQNAGDTTIDMRGVAIPCFPMELTL
jgi:N-acetylglutamate synthase-like GNAT family acetyltransferase